MSHEQCVRDKLATSAFKFIILSDKNLKGWGRGGSSVIRESMSIDEMAAIARYLSNSTMGVSGGNTGLRSRRHLYNLVLFLWESRCVGALAMGSCVVLGVRRNK